MVNKTRKAREKRNKRMRAEQGVLESKEDRDTDVNKKIKTKANPAMRPNDRSQ